MKYLALLLLSVLSASAQVVTVTNAPVISTTIYTNGISLGGCFALYTNSSILRPTTVYLQGLSIEDVSNQKAAVTLMLFVNTNGWTLADHGAITVPANSIDQPTIQALATTDWVTIGGKAFATISNLNKPVQIDVNNTVIYAAWMITGTPTYAATNDLRFKYFLSQ